MGRGRQGGRDTSDERHPPRAENGYFILGDLDNDEFDYGLKDPGADPPVGQFELSDRLRLLYGWCVDHVSHDDKYRDYLRRLRAAFFMGAVQEPVNLPAAKRLMDEIERDIVDDANRLLRAAAIKSAIWYLVITALSALSYVAIIFLLLHFRSFETGGAENYLLIAAAAVAALAVRTRARTPLMRLADYRAQAELYDQGVVPALLTAVLVVGITVCVQNKLVTLTVAGASIDVQKSVSTALGLGFILGIGDVRLLPWIMQRADRILGRSTGGAARGRSRAAGG